VGERRPGRDGFAWELLACLRSRRAGGPDANCGCVERGRLSSGDLSAVEPACAASARLGGLVRRRFVGACLERSIELIVGPCWAFSRRAGAYLPMDPRYPAPRIAYDGGCAGARLVKQEALLMAALGQRTQERAPPGAADGMRRPLRAGTHESSLSRRGAPPRICESTHRDRPRMTKGVVVEHASLANKISDWGNELPCGARVSVGADISCNFDASIEQSSDGWPRAVRVIVLWKRTRKRPVISGRQIARDGGEL